MDMNQPSEPIGINKTDQAILNALSDGELYSSIDLAKRFNLPGIRNGIYLQERLENLRQKRLIEMLKRENNILWKILGDKNRLKCLECGLVFSAMFIEAIRAGESVICERCGFEHSWQSMGLIFSDRQEQELFYRNSIELDSKNYKLWFNLGLMSTDSSQKEKCFRKVVELKPELADAWYNLGTILSDNQEKEKCYRKVIKLNSNDADAWHNLGTVLTDKKEQEKCFQKAEQLGFKKET